MENGDFVLYINPEGYLIYPQSERVFILKHEWTHWMEEHPLQARFYDKLLWNYSCDMSINPHLETMFCKRPSDAQMPNMYGLPPDLTPEQYYARLESGKFELPKEEGTATITPLQTENKDSIPTFLVHGPITKYRKVNDSLFLVRLGSYVLLFNEDSIFHDKKGHVIPFSALSENEYAEVVCIKQEGAFVGLQFRLSSPRPQQGKTSGKGQTSSASTVQESLEGKKRRLKEQEDMHPKWDSIKDSSPNMNKQTLQNVINQVGSSLGEEAPEAIRKKMTVEKDSQMNWKQELHYLVKQLKGQKKIYTYRKRNRRIPYAPARKKAPRLKLVVILDTSASITEEKLNDFNSELRRILKTHSNIQIIVIVCDEEIRDVFEFTTKSIRQGVTFGGGAGTDFRPPFALIEDRGHPLLKQKPDIVLYLTDGLGPAPSHFNLPTIWCLTTPGQVPIDANQKPQAPITWGKFIHLT